MWRQNSDMVFRKVDCRKHQHLIHRKHKMSIPLDSFFISQCFCNGLPQHDSGILDRVVAVYLQVSGNFDSQIKSPCLAKPESIWSKKPIPVEMSVFPVPSRFSVISICVSFCHTTAGCNSALHLFSPPLQNVHGSNWHAQSAVPLFAKLSISLCTFCSASLE